MPNKRITVWLEDEEWEFIRRLARQRTKLWASDGFPDRVETPASVMRGMFAEGLLDRQVSEEADEEEE